MIPFPGGLRGAAAAAAASAYFQTLDVQHTGAAGAQASLSYVMPANTLDTDEDGLLIVAAGFADDAELGALRFGGTGVATPSVGNDSWFVMSFLTRVGASSQRYESFALNQGGAFNLTRGALAINLAAPVTIDAMYPSGDAGDYVSYLGVFKTRRA
jgi:hypothetical protein